MAHGILQQFMPFLCFVYHWHLYVKTNLSHSQFDVFMFHHPVAPKPSERFGSSSQFTMAPRRPLLPLLAAACVPAFVGTRGTAAPRSRIARRAENFIPLDAVEPAVTSYVTWAKSDVS